MTEDRRALHDHLEATAELPVRPAASVWIGEAAAIAADIVDADLPQHVVVDRARHIADLLGEVSTTGNAQADDHVRAAERIAERIVERETDENGATTGG